MSGGCRMKCNSWHWCTCRIKDGVFLLAQKWDPVLSIKVSRFFVDLSRSQIFLYPTHFHASAYSQRRRGFLGKWNLASSFNLVLCGFQRSYIAVSSSSLLFLKIHYILPSALQLCVIANLQLVLRQNIPEKSNSIKTTKHIRRIFLQGVIRIFFKIFLNKIQGNVKKIMPKVSILAGDEGLV